MNKLQALNDWLIECSKAYFTDNAPLVTDEEYDAILLEYKKLRLLNPGQIIENDILSMIGAAPSKLFNSIAHTTPMLSLNNIFSENDLEMFITRIKKFLLLDNMPSFTCEAKIDGLSFCARYQHGLLTQGLTRGNGEEGEDITQNLKTIQSLPQKIDPNIPFLEVRGEVYIDKADFIALNQEQVRSNKTPFANPRNAAAGSLRQLNHRISQARPLKYFVYTISHNTKHFALTQIELLTRLRALGFTVNGEHTVAHSIEQILDFYHKLDNIRESLPYQIDGVVYKINDFSLQERLGFNVKAPKFAVAHKFSAVHAISRVLNIVMQVGRTGVITPVAKLEPTELEGVTISSATLHNLHEIQRKDIMIGDWVKVYRAGDVVPKILSVELSKRDGTQQSFVFDGLCPSCAQPISEKTTINDKIIKCVNYYCPAQVLEKLVHFVSRQAMDIEGLSVKQLKILLDQGLITNYVDLFTLYQHYDKLLSIPRFGSKSVQNLLSNIDKARNIPLDRFIYALGINHVGFAVARSFAQEFSTVTNFICWMKKLRDNQFEAIEKLDSISGIATKTILDMQKFLKQDENWNILQRLSSILDIPQYLNTERSLNNKTFAFSGTLNSMSRAEAKQRIENLGGKVSSVISGKVTYLILGEGGGRKIEKAKSVGVAVLSEEEFLKII